AVAARLRDDASDGVWFVDLAPLGAAHLVAGAVAGALGVPETARRDPLRALRQALAGRRVLLLLDNCEHVLGAAREGGGLRGACPGRKVLAPSREPLHLRWEHEAPLGPLAVPDAGGPAGLGALDALRRVPAVRLFVERAQAVRPGFRLTT